MGVESSAASSHAAPISPACLPKTHTGSTALVYFQSFHLNILDPSPLVRDSKESMGGLSLHMYMLHTGSVYKMYTSTFHLELFDLVHFPPTPCEPADYLQTSKNQLRPPNYTFPSLHKKSHLHFWCFEHNTTYTFECTLPYPMPTPQPLLQVSPTSHIYCLVLIRRPTSYFRQA